MNRHLSPENQILVSFCNQFVSPEYSLAVVNPLTGSCLWIDLGTDELILSGLQGVTGIAEDERSLFVFTQGKNPALVSICKKSLSVLFTKPLIRIKDPHSSVLLNSVLYTVSTGTNQIFSIDVSDGSPGEESLFWSYPNTDTTYDTVHLNGLSLVNSRFVATCFGPRTSDGKWGADGRLFFLDSNETLLDQLNNPHSPYVKNGTIYVAESKTGVVHRLVYSQTHHHQWLPLEPILIGGYVRGLYALNGDLYVGVSAERCFSRSQGHPVSYDNGSYRGKLLRVSLSTLAISETKGFSLFGDEVYDINAAPKNLSSKMLDHVSAACDRLLYIKQLLQTLSHKKNFLVNQCAEIQESLDHAKAELSNTSLDLSTTSLNLRATQESLDHAKAELSNTSLDLSTTSLNLRATQESLDHVNVELARVSQVLRHRENEIFTINAETSLQKIQIEDLELKIGAQDKDIANYRKAIDQLLASNSWRITKPLRTASNFIKTAARRIRLLRRVPALLRATDRNRFSALIRYLSKGDLVSITSKVEILLSDIESIEFRAYLGSEEGLRLCIMTTRHTEYVAHNIAQVLHKHGHDVEITTHEPAKFDHDFYFVLCPQMFGCLPPGQKRVAFQLEQSVSERWFTQEYIDMLRHCFAVLDYSQINIAFLSKHECAYPHVYYLPIGATTRWADQSLPEKKYQILFYGDYKSSPRRLMMLDALDSVFDVERVDNLFGEPLREKIREAHIVINLHYYDGALLETTRIQECLSLGVRVVSETSPDLSDYPELVGIVKFFACGDKEEMIDAVRQILDTPFDPVEHSGYLTKSEHHFQFMLDRFLFSSGFLGLDSILSSEPEIPGNKDFYAISLPETQHRRRFIMSELPANSYLFDGVRFSPGWLGCALSYIKLFQAAQKFEMRRITIMEDDVVLPENFTQQFEIITEYLDRDPSSWHIFSGLIAVLHPDVRILKQEVYKGLTFVTIDRMTSMVFNIYNQSILPKLLSWDASNQDAHTNTIDRYIEGLVDLRVVVVLPFFVGHREEAHSTLWGIENTHYADLIATTEDKLVTLMLEAQQNSGIEETTSEDSS